MALYFSRIFTLIFIIKLVALSLAVRVVPEGFIREIRLQEGIRQANDHIVQYQVLHITATRFRINEHEEIFHTEGNQIITQVLVMDGAFHEFGVRVEIIRNGVGYQNVTLRFISARSSAMVQVVMLFGH